MIHMARSALYMVLSITFLLFSGCENNPQSHADEIDSSHYDNLKELDWLIGKWQDADEHIDINFENGWDKNKNFLIQQFSMKVENKQDLQGKQIIGWDPSKEQIHSWIFDSDGGFGNGLWSQNGDIWYVNVLFVLPDGKKASTTHIYKKIDNNTYTFASIGRDIDGQILPDIGPFKVIRN